MEDIDLNVLKSDLTAQEAEALRILNEGLTSQPDPAKLARTLREHCSTFESFAAAGTFIEQFWMVLLDVLAIVPIDHPWHEALIATVDELRREGGPIVNHEVSSLYLLEAG